MLTGTRFVSSFVMILAGALDIRVRLVALNGQWAHCSRLLSQAYEPELRADPDLQLDVRQLGSPGLLDGGNDRTPSSDTGAEAVPSGLRLTAAAGGETLPYVVLKTLASYTVTVHKVATVVVG